MKVSVLAAASALAVVPMLTNGASASVHQGGAWTFTDYTPDPAVFAASQALYTTTGRAATSFCGGRVPSSPQDITAHRLVVSRTSVLSVHLANTGAWGLQVDRRGSSVAGVATGSTTSVDGLDVKLRVRPGIYSVKSCNLGGAPTAQASYRLSPVH